MKKNEIKIIHGNYALLIGSINKDINLSLIKDLIQENIKLLIIGPEIIISDEWNEIKTLKNITYLGAIHAKMLSHYIAASKVCLVAYEFKNTIDKNSRSPLKIMNYLVQYKPIVTSTKVNLISLETKGIYFANNNAEYIQLVKKGINDELFVDDIIISEYLRNHKYPHLIHQILDQLY